MDISSTSGLAGYAYTPSSNKTDTSASLAMLNKANEMQADSAEQMIQSVTETASSARALPDHIGRNINLTA
ncbi:YjfB family protein [Allochromatium humboldtianum]|uniref:YjfB family protein n=1 Tax=Allochromatium humboldtianum TaxID=504901 RepID=A0A850RDV7_9GAMM|nr:YjfB family protein [Allochromatium humboldtianum]NVZ09140.1 YjfB family protein [Allochromatium humboldtianum]